MPDQQQEAACVTGESDEGRLAEIVERTEALSRVVWHQQPAQVLHLLHHDIPFLLAEVSVLQERIRAAGGVAAEAMRMIGFLRSCVASGERLSAADDKEISRVLAALTPTKEG